MAYLLLAPHSDDEGLFAAFIMQRCRPMRVVVVTDSVQHEKKYGVERGVLARRKESVNACGIINTPVEFLGISDEKVTLNECIQKFQYIVHEGIVFVPALQHGNEQHDTISRAAELVFRDRCLFYSTYTPDSFVPTGELAIHPTAEERRLKELMLGYYHSQLELNKHHFDAVAGQPEYLNLKKEPVI